MSEFKREVEQVITGDGERKAFIGVLVFVVLAVVTVSVLTGMTIGRHSGWKAGWRDSQATAHWMVKCVDGRRTRTNDQITCTPYNNNYISPTGYGDHIVDASVQVRSLAIQDGVSGQIALFDGGSHTSTFNGDVVVKGRLIVENHGPLSGRIVFDRVLQTAPTCLLATTSVTGFEYHCFSR